MREVCDLYGALFILDEIMCGMRRSGKIHAWQSEDLASSPDIQVNGKGLDGVYAPLAAILISAKVVMKPSLLDQVHSITYPAIHHMP